LGQYRERDDEPIICKEPSGVPHLPNTNSRGGDMRWLRRHWSDISRKNHALLAYQ
jgi:hypothetical protein